MTDSQQENTSSQQENPSLRENIISVVSAVEVLTDFPTSKTMWQEMGFNPERFAVPVPSRSDDPQGFINAVYHKLGLRLASEKVWSLQKKLLSCSLLLAAVGGIASTATASLFEKCTPVSIYSDRTGYDCSPNPLRIATAYATKLKDNQIYQLDLFLKLVFGVSASVLFSRYGVAFLMRSLDVSQEKNQALNAVETCFKNSLPDPQDYENNLPPDLMDEYRHLWFAEDGNPISKHFTTGDLKHHEYSRVGSRWVGNSIALGLAVASFPSLVAVAGLGLFGAWALKKEDEGVNYSPGFKTFINSPDFLDNRFTLPTALLGCPWNLPAIAFIEYRLFGHLLRKSFASQMSPLAIRAFEQDGGGALENAMFMQSGGKLYTSRVEAGRVQQITDAINDESPLFYLGETTGIMAERGNIFAPSKGLPCMMSLSDFTTHMIVFGGTGSGKTSCILRPVINQALEMENTGILILDGKNKLPVDFKGVKDVTYIEPENAVISLTGGLTPPIFVNTLVDIYQSKVSGDAVFWVNQGKNLMLKAAYLCEAAGVRNFTGKKIYNSCMTKAARDEIIQLVVERYESPDDIPLLVQESLNFFENEWDKMPDDDRTKKNIIESVRAFFNEFLQYTELQPWLEASAEDDTVDITCVLRGGRIAINIPQYKYFSSGAGIIALLKARIYSGIRARADIIGNWRLTSNQTDVLMVIDEVQEVLTQEDAVILPMARSIGLSFVAATQTIEGVEARLKEMSKQFIETFTSYAILPYSSTKTYEWAAKRPGGVFGSMLRDVQAISTIQTLNMEIAQTNQVEELGVFMTGNSGGKAASKHAEQVRFETYQEKAIKRYAGDGLTSTIGTFEMISAGELQHIVSLKQSTGFIVLNRARRLRIDFIELKPQFPKEEVTGG